VAGARPGGGASPLPSPIQPQFLRFRNNAPEIRVRRRAASSLQPAQPQLQPGWLTIGALAQGKNNGNQDGSFHSGWLVAHPADGPRVTAAAWPPGETTRLATLPYLGGYPSELLDRVRLLLAQGRVRDTLLQRHGAPHALRTDGALYGYVMDIKGRYLRTAEPLSRVSYDNRLHVVRNALGMHSTVSRVQGGRLKAKREIRIAGLFRDVPEPLLRMIVVHELAHLKERAHDRAFYALCRHMEPAYHQLEFDARLWLTAVEACAPAG
jgi:predicted metal-dependent hydrolase